jgi:uncharacterized protein
MNTLQECLAYIQQQHVLTLCCATKQQIWAAHCFYQLDCQNIALWIMTDSNTRHGQIMLFNPLVAGTIGSQQRDVQLLQGIQFQGIAQLVAAEERQRALVSYQTRFPEALQHQQPLWAIRLDEIKMTNNKKGFGHKQVWQRSSA